MCQLGSSLCIITGEDLISPLRVLKLLCLPIGNKDRRLRSLTLSVIEFLGCLVLGVVYFQAHLLETVLVHGASVREFQARVVPVNSSLVALRAVVDVGQAALVCPLFSYVHFNFSI